MNKNLLIKTLLSHTVGGFTVTADLYYDEDPMYSPYLGEFEGGFINNPSTYLYDRDNDVMWDGSVWKDDRGKIVSPPDTSTSYYRRECRFISLGTAQFKREDKGSLKMAFQNARKLDRMGNDWDFTGIVATVSFNGKELTSAGCWGFEHDGTKDNEKALLSEARNIAREAVDTARVYLKELSKSKAVQNAAN